jgi:DEAD/DEAH box helicase domain-containing protein
MASFAHGLAVRSQSAIDKVEEALAALAARHREDEVLTAIRHIPAREAQFCPMPGWVRPELAAAYRAKKIERLYSHQAAAAELARDGKNFVVVTPTSSGKTLCYNLPILNAILENPDARALYLFPTKALAQDQLAELSDLATLVGDSFGAFTYDGDTPSDARRAIRERGHIILTNPDMLHTGMLPHHTKWMRMFENLRYIVIDELHTYRGVFGSHLANVVRRLARIARFYGSTPQFIACSATIANPGELAAQLTETSMDVVEENGAPAAEKLFVFYNPPMVNRNLGIRRSYLNETTRVAKELLARNLQTIVFSNSRLHTEVLLTYLQQANRPEPGQAEPIRGYRGGYLPGERREIERGLRAGRIRGVVATNALELGIDIGSLDACVMAGYAGSIASTWQRAGRAGRRSGASCAVLVASSAPLDQFIVQHPDYFFGRSPEHAYVQPDNLEILVNHLKCAAFELPLAPDERFGNVSLPALCERLAEAGYLHRSGGNWHWVQEAYPADAVSLRSVTSDNFVIIDITGHPNAAEDGEPEVIGEVDFSSALTTVHPKAIYIHQGQQYHVERLDFDERKAYVKRVNVDYFTYAIRYTQVRVLEVAEEAAIAGPAARAHGDVLVRSQVVGFKKIKFFTNENVGAGKLELPENEMHTTAFWITLGHSLLARLPFALSERQSGIFGLLHALESMATLLLMCDRRDLGTAIGERPPGAGISAEASESDESAASAALADAAETKEFFEPNLYLYDAYPGGIGVSQPLFRVHDLLLRRTRELIAACPCEKGCPSCVGPAGEKSERTKDAALAILAQLVYRMSLITHDQFASLKALAPRRRRVPLADAEPRSFAPDIPEGSERLGQLVGGTPRANKFGEHLGLRRWFSELAGCDPPAAALDLPTLRLLAPAAPEEACHPEQWLFLDTETTGLAGGTGTYAFLVGIAWWDAGGLEVEQFFMREHSEEHSVLLALAERLAERRVLVTFNGKSFDWPLLETRYRMTRTIRPPAPRAHFDFLHPARSLWRLRLGSARLPELERHVLGWNRGTDVMSELIPSLYFDFLRGGPPEPLVPIFYHNQMDLRGLAALASRVLSVLADPETNGSDPLEVFGVSRICERRGEHRRARQLYERSLAAELPADAGLAARRALARLAKRDGDFPLAEQLWESMLGNSSGGFEAYEQLAIHCERRLRQLHRAAALARAALAELCRANRLGIIASAAHRRLRERFERRLARLERRASRGALLGAVVDESKQPAAESNQ